MKKKRSRSKRQDALWGYLFVAPFLIGFMVFMLGPMLFSFIGSFTDYNLTSKMNFIGFGNFKRKMHFFGNHFIIQFILYSLMSH